MAKPQIDPKTGEVIGSQIDPATGEVIGGASSHPNYLAPENLARVKNMNATPTQFEKQNSGLVRQFAHRIADYLPAAGGAIGGTVGSGVLTIPAAALGGAAGTGAKQLLNRSLGFDSPATSHEAAEEMGTEGVKQGAYEAGGRLIGAVGRAVAPGLARAALKIPKALESRGAQTGRGILDETSALSPAKVSEQAKARIADLSAEHDAASAGAQVVPLAPARGEIDSSIQEGMKRNSPTELRQLNDLKDMVTVQHGPSGKPLTSPVMSAPAGFVPGSPVQTGSTAVNLPAVVPGPRIRDIRQGIGATRGNWNAPPSDFVDSATERLYGKLNEPLHAAVPATKVLDQRMSNLIPVATYADKAANRAGLGENLLTAKGSGIVNAMGALGAASGGAAGAGVGALAGRVLPEIASRPSARLAAARVANSPLTPLISTAALRLIDGSQKKKGEEDEQ